MDRTPREHNFRRNAWAWLILGTIAFWGILAWLVFG